MRLTNWCQLTSYGPSAVSHGCRHFRSRDDMTGIVTSRAEKRSNSQPIVNRSWTSRFCVRLLQSSFPGSNKSRPLNAGFTAGISLGQVPTRHQNCTMPKRRLPHRRASRERPAPWAAATFAQGRPRSRRDRRAGSRRRALPIARPSGHRRPARCGQGQPLHPE